MHFKHIHIRYILVLTPVRFLSHFHIRSFFSLFLFSISVHSSPLYRHRKKKLNYILNYTSPVKMLGRFFCVFRTHWLDWIKIELSIYLSFVFVIKYNIESEKKEKKRRRQRRQIKYKIFFLGINGDLFGD